MFNRNGVIRSLKTVKHILSNQKNNNPTKGLLIFSSPINHWIISDNELPRPISHNSYICDNKFDISILKSIKDCNDGPLYGFIVIDGDHCIYSTVQGIIGSEHIDIVKKIHSHIAGRTRRGGQSALRFDRLRDDSEDKYINKCIEETKCLDSCDCIIISGKANIKNIYGSRLDKKYNILGYITISDSLEDGLYQTIDKSKELRDRYENRIEYDALTIFNNILNTNSELLVFGVRECNKMIEYGIIKTLILSKHMKPHIINKLETNATNIGAEVLKIKGITSDGDMFCKNYKCAGILRYII